MSDKFQNKYRIPTARADWWDYGWNGAYFITICTAHRENYLGKIFNRNDNNNDGTGRSVETGQCPVSTNPHSSKIDITPTMQLSEIGRLSEKFWLSIPDHFPFVKLGALVVMPNHIHGILIIDKPNGDRENNGNGGFEIIDGFDGFDGFGRFSVETGQCPVSTPKTPIVITTPTTNPTPIPIENHTSEPKTPGELRLRNQGKDTISSIVGSFKSIVTRQAHRICAGFEWQERFYDHIIRDEDEFDRITHYIENNVRNWTDDKFYN